MDFKPTLIIGLGGSGTFVARRLKKRLRRLTDVTIPPSIQILAFDTDKQSEHSLLDKLPPAEFHLIDNFNGAAFVAPPSVLAQQEGLKDWWKYERLDPGFIKDGAKQRPPVGRLALFAQFERKIKPEIQASIERIFRKSASYTPPNTNSINVHVIGSSCGGTGAGMLFDIAIIARSIIEDAGREALMQAHVFLPSCFESTSAEKKSLQANAFAFFRTMEAMQSGSLPAVKYPGRVVAAHPSGYLFRRVHLLSSTAMSGVTLRETQDIYETTALQLDLQIAGEAITGINSILENETADFNIRPHGRLAVYSSYECVYSSGAPDIGRLAILPDFVRALASALVAPGKNTASNTDAIQNGGFAHLRAVLSNESAALELLPEYQNVVMRIKKTAEPELMAAQLQSQIDLMLDGLSSEQLAPLRSLSKEIRETAGRLIAGGGSGISNAVAWLERARGEISAIIEKAKTAEMAKAEPPSLIVGTLRKLFASKEKKKTDLIAKALPYLRDQCIISVRKTLGERSRLDLTASASTIDFCLAQLSKFGSMAASLYAGVEMDTREKISEKQKQLGERAVPVDPELARKNFRAKSEAMCSAFFVHPSSPKALTRVAQGLLEETPVDSWRTALVSYADDFLGANLAADNALPTNWYETAAQKMLECRPLVRFAPNHSTTSIAEPVSIAVARVYGREGVNEALANAGSDFKPQTLDSDEPGSLEMTTVVVNFGLWKLQEMRLIEEGAKQWLWNTNERSENRYAWRGPKEIWQKIEALESLLPPSDDKQAFARLLAFDPVPPAEPVAVQTATTYFLDGKVVPMDSESTRYRRYKRFNDEVLATGTAEKLLQSWTKTGASAARSHAERLGAALKERIERAEKLDSTEDDWEDYIGMLRAERQALENAINKIAI